MSESTAKPQFISRADAAQKLGYDLSRRYWRLRNYEYEQRLYEAFGGDWCISEWCPFNGRFCSLRDHVAYPHPPQRGGYVQRPVTDIPWRTCSGSLVDKHIQTDLPPSGEPG